MKILCSFFKKTNPLKILQECGIKPAMKIVQWFNILPDFNVDDVFLPPQESPLFSNANPNDLLPMADLVEERIGYKFNNRGYLLQVKFIYNYFFMLY